MNEYKDEVKSLKAKIEQLEAENRVLKRGFQQNDGHSLDVVSSLNAININVQSPLSNLSGHAGLNGSTESGESAQSNVSTPANAEASIKHHHDNTSPTNNLSNSRSSSNENLHNSNNPSGSQIQHAHYESSQRFQQQGTKSQPQYYQPQSSIKLSGSSDSLYYHRTTPSQHPSPTTPATGIAKSPESSGIIITGHKDDNLGKSIEAYTRESDYNHSVNVSGLVGHGNGMITNVHS